MYVLLNLFQVRLVHDNVLNVDFSSATAVFVYLLPEGMKLLKDRFLDVLARGGRIVSYGMPSAPMPHCHPCPHSCLQCSAYLG